MWGNLLIASKEETNRKECRDAVFLQVTSSSLACAAFEVHTTTNFRLELVLYLATN